MAASVLIVFVFTSELTAPRLHVRIDGAEPCGLGPASMGYVMNRRQRSNHTLTFEERLKQQAERLRHEARGLPLGTKRIELLKRARQAETAAGISRWLTSSHQKPPDLNPEVFS